MDFIDLSIKAVTDPTWWITTVIGVILLNVLSSYVIRYLDTKYADAKSYWALSNKKRLDQEKEIISKLRNSEKYREYYLFMLEKTRFVALISITLSLGAMIMTLCLHNLPLKNQVPLENSKEIITLIMMALSTLMLVRSLLVVTKSIKKANIYLLAIYPEKQKSNTDQQTDISN